MSMDRDIAKEDLVWEGWWISWLGMYLLDGKALSGLAVYLLRPGGPLSPLRVGSLGCLPSGLGPLWAVNI